MVLYSRAFVGGFDLAAEWMGWENVFQVEWDSYCQKVLTKNFPNVKRYGDIKEFDGTKYRGFIDIISGGFPCQPFSNAGKRKGTEDDRYLWPEMLRIIGEAKPPFIVGENVAGLISMENGKTLKRIFTDLENEGYQTESFIIPACAVGAWHRRDRIWIVAYNNSVRCDNGKYSLEKGSKGRCESLHRNEGLDKTISDSQGKRINGINRDNRITETENGEWTNESISNSKDATNGHDKYREKYIRGNQLGNEIEERTLRRSYKINGRQWEVEPSVGRVADGVSGRVDRLKGLGNSIVPQVAYQIFKAIEEYELSKI